MIEKHDETEAEVIRRIVVIRINKQIRTREEEQEMADPQGHGQIRDAQCFNCKEFGHYASNH